MDMGETGIVTGSRQLYVIRGIRNDYMAIYCKSNDLVRRRGLYRYQNDH